MSTACALPSLSRQLTAPEDELFGLLLSYATQFSQCLLEWTSKSTSPAPLSWSTCQGNQAQIVRRSPDSASPSTVLKSLLSHRAFGDAAVQGKALVTASGTATFQRRKILTGRDAVMEPMQRMKDLRFGESK